MDRPIEPGLLRIFRYFTAVAMAYFALALVFTILQTERGFTLQLQSTLNFATNLALFGYLSWPWLMRRLRRWYLPVALVAATVIPVFSNLLYYAGPPETDLFRIIVRSWLVLPILLVPLVLIAWQYRFRYVLAFIIFTALVELAALVPVVDRLDMDTISLLGIPLMHAFAFGTVGHIVMRLAEAQLAQRKELMRANLQLARHAQTLEQLATSRERNRLARELHDTLAHTLSGLAVNLEAMKTIGVPDEPELSSMLEHSLTITRTGLAETRRALKDLRAQPLEDLGLCLALRNQACSVASRANLDLAVDLPEHIDGLSPQSEQNLFRIAQEGLENIVCHANARRASLSLRPSPQGITLTILDDGCGFELDQETARAGYGLRGMRERAEEMGAEFTFLSQPGAGTKLEIFFRTGSSPETPAGWME